MKDLNLPIGMRNRLKAFQKEVTNDKENSTYKKFTEGKASLTDVTKVMIGAARLIGRSKSRLSSATPINTHSRSN
jgi:hypothetical protein